MGNAKLPCLWRNHDAQVRLKPLTASFVFLIGRDQQPQLGYRDSFHRAQSLREWAIHWAPDLDDGVCAFWGELGGIA